MNNYSQIFFKIQTRIFFNTIIFLKRDENQNIAKSFGLFPPKKIIIKKSREERITDSLS